MQHIVITGGPVGGYSYYGPFADNASANAWGQNNLENKHWWTQSISPGK